MRIDGPSQNASIRILQATTFRARLESHISDVEAGIGGRSAKVHTEVREKHMDTSDFLARFQPKVLGQYLGLLSGMKGYGEQHRFATTMSELTTNVEAINQAVEAYRQVQEAASS